MFKNIIVFKTPVNNRNYSNSTFRQLPPTLLCSGMQCTSMLCYSMLLGFTTTRFPKRKMLFSKQLSSVTVNNVFILTRLVAVHIHTCFTISYV